MGTARLASQTHPQIEAAGRDRFDPFDFGLLSPGGFVRFVALVFDGLVSVGVIGIAGEGI